MGEGIAGARRTRIDRAGSRGGATSREPRAAANVDASGGGDERAVVRKDARSRGANGRAR
jgi:hypothetical protein